MEKYDVIVLGSINLDVFVSVPKYPNYGDTMIADSITMLPGGKGANQAIAVSKQDAKMLFLGSVGADSAGKQMLQNLQDFGIDTSNIQINEHKDTGTFVIMLDKQGENTMAGTLGANQEISTQYIQDSLSQVEAEVLLLQMETSKESILSALEIAKSKGMYIILDPAPADGYFQEALSYVDVITPNQQETKKITGITVTDEESALQAAKKIESLGVSNCVIKMGAGGNLVYQQGKHTFVPALKVEAKNTVGAGDTFAGALASAYVKTKDLVKAVQYGNVAAGMKVSQAGGQETIPTNTEVEQYMVSHKK